MPQSTPLTRTSAITPIGGSISARNECPSTPPGSAGSATATAASPRSRWIRRRRPQVGQVDRRPVGRRAREGHAPGFGLPDMGQVDGDARRPGRRTAPANRPGAAPGAADHDHDRAAGGPGSWSLSTITVAWYGCNRSVDARIEPTGPDDAPGVGVPFLVPAAGRPRRERGRSDGRPGVDHQIDVRVGGAPMHHAHLAFRGFKGVAPLAVSTRSGE